MSIKAPKLDKVYSADKTSEFFWVDPTFLDLGYNSRIHAEANEKQDDISRAVDIHNAGQLVPCVVRRKDDGKLELIAGFGRCRSVTLIRNGFKADEVQYHDADRKLLVRIDDNIKTDAEAFIASIRENVRKEVSPINVAAQQEVLRKDYGLSDTAIAEVYGYNNTNAISRNKKLLTAPKEVQELVHKGDLSVDATVNLLKLPKEDQDALLAGGGKVTAAKVNEVIAARIEKKEAAGEDTTGAKKEATGVRPRNTAALVKTLDGILDDADAEPALHDAVVTFLKDLKKFVANRITEDTFVKKVTALSESVKK